MRNLFFVLFLLLPSVCFGQMFETSFDHSLYVTNGHTAQFIPTSSDYAILHFKYRPYSGSSYVLDFAEIIPSVNRSDVQSLDVYGFQSSDRDNPDSWREWWVVCDASTLYGNTSRIANTFNCLIYDELLRKGLGTVEQRAAYIASFKIRNVTLIDTSQIGQSIVEMLGPWAVVGLGLAIALFGIDLGTRSQKKLLGSAAKEARSAERKVINAQIRADGVAQAYRTRLSLLAQAKRGDIKLKGYSRFGARQAFYDTARDYADYKRSKGWTL